MQGDDEMQTGAAMKDQVSGIKRTVQGIIHVYKLKRRVLCLVEWGQVYQKQKLQEEER